MMFHFAEEGKLVKDGINVYRLSDKSSFGFIIRYGNKVEGTEHGSILFSVRYSKNIKEWFIGRTEITQTFKTW